MVASGQKRLPIDEAFPVDFANELARREVYNKHHYRPNSYLHKWWARRCGTTFRLILKGLVEEEAARSFLAPAGLEGKIILDPMMGGGTTLHEAIRLGANVIGADIDPIPVLQARATLSKVPLSDLEAAYEGFSQSLHERLAPYYEVISPDGQPTPLRYLLYGSRRQCTCGEVIQVDSFCLRHEPAVRVAPQRQLLLQGDVVLGELDHLTAGRPLISKQNKQCPACGGRYKPLLSQPYAARLLPLITVTAEPGFGLKFRPVTPADIELLASAEAALASSPWVEADFPIPAGPKSHDLCQRGISSYLQLFGPRQRLYLQTCHELLAPLAAPLRLNLALLVSTSLEFNSLLCGYKGANPRRPGAIRHVFAHHAYGFPYTVVENNPLFQPAGRKASGTLGQLFHDRIRRGRQWAQAPVERLPNGRGSKLLRIATELDEGTEVAEPVALATGQRRFLLHQGSAVQLPLPADSVDYVVTDPPYFDSVQYGDLANFFHVWLRRFLPGMAHWDYELGQAAVDPRDEAAHPDGAYDFAQVLGEIFVECARVLKPATGRLIFTYHHGKAAGWAGLTEALAAAGFKLINFYIVHSESPRSLHINGLQALTHDAILVFAPQQSRDWPEPTSAAQPDSAAFAGRCAQTLGWLLGQPQLPPDLVAIWTRYLALA